jgi:hypothetical protein
MHQVNLKSASLRLVFIVCLIIVSFPFYACADVLFGDSYHETMHTYIKKADTSITVAMYFIIIDPKEGHIIQRSKCRPPHNKKHSNILENYRMFW